MTGWIWPFDAVQNWFEDLYNYVGSASTYAVSFVEDWVKDAGKLVSDTLDPIIRGVTSSVDGFIDTAISTISGAVNIVGVSISGFFDILWTTLSDGWNWLSTAVSGYVNALWTDIQAGWNILTTAVTGYIDSLWTSISAGFTALTDTVGNIAGSIWDSVAGLAGDLLNGMAEALGVVLPIMWTSLTEGASAMVTGIISITSTVAAGINDFIAVPINNLMLGAIEAIMPGSPSKEVKETSEQFIKALQELMVRHSPKEGSSPPDLAILLGASGGLTAAIIGLYTLTTTVSTALDAVHPVKGWGFKAAIMDIMSTLSIQDITGPLIQAPIWASLIKPLRMRYNQLFPFGVPGTTELIRMRNQRIIDQLLYEESMSFDALSVGWSEYLRLSGERVPSYGDLQRMKWRDKLSTDQVLDAQRHMQVPETYIPGYEALLEPVPGIGDLITMVVREAFVPRVGDDKMPERFVIEMAKFGFTREQCLWYWRKHWDLPALGNVYEMLHRGITMPKTIEEFLVVADYDPAWHDALEELSWNIPGRIETRWLIKWGIWKPERAKEMLGKGGLAEEYRDDVVRALVTNVFLGDINKLRDNSKKDYAEGFILEPQLRADLAELGYSDVWIEYHVQDAMADSERSIKKSAVTLLEKYYLGDYFAEEDLRTYLAKYIINPGILDAKVDLLYVSKFKKPS